MKATKINLLCGEPLKFAASNDGAPARFEMVAYTGASMETAGYDLPVVVDLNGIELAKPKIPVFYAHSFQRGIGHVEKSEIRDGKLVVEGVASRKTEWAEDFTSSSRAGFPWEASIGAYPTKIAEVRAGETVDVNGRTFEGPLYVVEAAKLYEISVVEYGADSATSSTVVCGSTLENKEEKPTMETKNEKKEPETGVETNDVERSIQAAREAQAREVERVEEIRRRAKSVECSGETLATAIRDGWEPDRFELEILRASRPTAPTPRTSGPKLTDGALEIVALRAGATGFDEKRYSEADLEAADRYRDAGLEEFVELVCGQPLPRYKRDAKGWLRAAFSTTALSYVLSRAANAALLAGFEYVESEWRQAFKISSVHNFQAHERYRLSDGLKFEKVPRGSRLKHGTVSDEKYEVKAGTYGIMFALEREDLRNDDLGALTRIPQRIGMGAADAVNEACWELFLNPPKTKDGKDFYSTANKNLLTGAKSELSLDAISEARKQFAKMTRKGGAPIGVRPSILLVPPELEDKALMLTKATQFVGGADGTLSPSNYNPQVGRFKVVSSSYLSAEGWAGASEKAWFLLTDPNRLAAFEVAFLDGKDQPTVEQADADFDTLGVQFRGYVDFGVAAQDFRGVVKSTGEA